MKDIYKNPTLYYILVPVMLALWPLLVWAVYLPKAEHNLNSDIAQYEKALETMKRVLGLDPDRLEFTDAKTGAAEFDYTNEVYRIAALCKIPAANFKLSSGIPIRSHGQKSQTANVSLKDIDVTRFAEFLSKIQLRWANLQCTKVKLIKKRGLRDKWDVSLTFKYYY